MATSKHVADAPEKITEYIDVLPDWSKKICRRLREIILKSDPGIVEDWKWGPNYYLDGMVCGYAAFQKHVNLAFFKGALLKDKQKLLTPNATSQNTRSIKFSSVKEINEDVLLEYLIEAIDNNKSGKKVVVKDKTVLIPADVKRAFASVKLLAYFESLAYSHRKEYIYWIGEAKKEETRQKRIEKAITMLGKKEMMHDKYKK